MLVLHPKLVQFLRLGVSIKNLQKKLLNNLVSQEKVLPILSDD